MDVEQLLNAENPGELSRKMLLDLRRRIANGEAVPPEELAEGVRKLRQMYGEESRLKQAANVGKAVKKGSKAAKASGVKVNADDLLNGILKGL